MKTRIIEQHGKFYPQFKCFFLWNYWMGEGGTCEYDIPSLSFSTLEEARRFCRKKEAEDQDEHNAKRAIHNT